MLKKMTGWDKLLILGLAVLSLSALGFFFWQQESHPASKLILRVEVDGVEVDRHRLRDLKIGQRLTYDTQFGHNELEIAEDGVFVHEASCPDQICVLQGKIDKAGQMLICLPNRFLAILESTEKEPPQVDAQTR